jgi:NADH dehydrogenase
MRNKVVTIFGGSGFVGRHLVRRVARLGATVRVPTRRPERANFLRPLGDVGQIVLEPWDADAPGALERLIGESAYVVNLIGILAARRKGVFEAVQGRLPGLIGTAAREAGVRRFVQVSAIGADRGSSSLYARTKAEGEEAAHAAFPETVVLRPSVIFGPEDEFFNRFARMAMISPALPLIGGGGTRFQPVFVGDVADAIVAALRDDAAAGRTYELGGPKIYTFRELMELMLRLLNRRRALVSLPYGLAALQARFLQLLPEPPLTVDQVELLKRDNVVAPGALTLRDLGVEPTPLEVVVPAYLQAYAAAPARLPVA